MFLPGISHALLTCYSHFPRAIPMDWDCAGCADWSGWLGLSDWDSPVDHAERSADHAIAVSRRSHGFHNYSGLIPLVVRAAAPSVQSESGQRGPAARSVRD